MEKIDDRKTRLVSAPDPFHSHSTHAHKKGGGGGRKGSGDTAYTSAENWNAKNFPMWLLPPPPPPFLCACVECEWKGSGAETRRRASNLGKLLYTLVIYHWLHADVNSYRICSFVLAQDCPRIDGVRRLMAYSTTSPVVFGENRKDDFANSFGLPVGVSIVDLDVSLLGKISLSFGSAYCLARL